ncbi:YceI family protein [Amaricoccus macauensis]|uniref:YceI family protein n=1 Tax=Amaricoccus macauensis TaxID=57001 RepID=UPI003C7A8367
MTLRSALLGAAIVLTPLPALAQEWEVDPSHSNILFSVEHFGFADIKGVFREFEADVTFDPEDLGATEASVTIDAASIDTFWEARDEHIKSGDMFDVENFPEITFVSTDVTVTGDATAELTGDLTLHGETHPVTFEAVLNKIDANPFDSEKRNAGFTITGVVDRSLFGVDYAAPMVATEIPVTINVELIGPAE